MPKRRPSSPAPSKLDQLTAREHEVFALIAQGLSTAEISDRIHRSPKTVESHRLSLGRKLGVNNRVQLARLAYEHGVITVGDGQSVSEIALYEQLRAEAARYVATEEALRNIDAAVGAVTGQAFFDTLTTHLVKALSVRACYIATLRGETIRVLSSAPQFKGPHVLKFPSTLHITREIAGGSVVRLAADNPSCSALSQVLDLPVSSLIAAPLFDSVNRWVGDMVILHDEEIDAALHPEYLLRIFSVRAGAEIERRSVEDELIRTRNLLEERVIDRTRELNEANKRLSASYEVLKSALESLSRQEQWLRDIVDYSPAVIFAKDLEGRYITVNQRFEEVFNVTREAIQGKTDYDIFDKSHSDAFREVDAQVFNECRAIEAEEVAPHEDGPHTYISIKFPLLNAVGKPYGICGISTDITERTRAENLRGDFNAILEKIAVDALLPEILEDITLAAERRQPGMFCSILLLDADGIHLRHGAAPSLPRQYVTAVDGAKIGPVSGSCGTAAFTRKLVIASDISTDARWAEYRHFALQHGLSACWSQPILGTSGNVLGTFAMYYTAPRGPGENEIELIEEAARIARIAIEHESLQRRVHALSIDSPAKGASRDRSPHS